MVNIHNARRRDRFVGSCDRRRYDTKQISLFLCDYWNKLDGVFTEFTLFKAIDAESPIVIFFGTVSIFIPADVYQQMNEW